MHRQLMVAILLEAEFASLYGDQPWYPKPDDSVLREVHHNGLAIDGAVYRLRRRYLIASDSLSRASI